MKMHIAQSGKQEGYYVECPARISCTIQAEEDHMHFNSTKEANEYSELKIAKEFGGVFGSGISQRESTRMAELEEISKKNTPVIENVKDNSEKVKSLLNTEKRPEYIASIDKKHFDGSTSGSTFTDPSVKNSSDVLDQAVIQRGNLDGDDRELLIAAGADPSSFLPPESGVRYLKVNIDGTQALKDTSTLDDNDVLHIVAKGGNDGRPPSLSFSFDVSEQPKTKFGTVVIGPDLDENKKPIPNTEVLWTMHPGIPTRGIRSDTIRENKLDAGSKITVKELRQRFGKDIQVNTRLV